MGRVSLTSLPSMVLANMPVSKTGASMSSMCGVKDDWALFWLRSTKISQTVWLSGSGFRFSLQTYSDSAFLTYLLIFKQHHPQSHPTSNPDINPRLGTQCSMPLQFWTDLYWNRKHMQPGVHELNACAIMQDWPESSSVAHMWSTKQQHLTKYYQLWMELVNSSLLFTLCHKILLQTDSDSNMANISHQFSHDDYYYYYYFWTQVHDAMQPTHSRVSGSHGHRLSFVGDQSGSSNAINYQYSIVCAWAVISNVVCFSRTHVPYWEWSLY